MSSTGRYLVTTSDYYPTLGGLTTFCTNIEKSLNACEIPYDLFHWKKKSDFLKIKDSKYKKVIHVHPWGSYYHALVDNRGAPTINFYHGSEVLFLGRTPFHSLFKKIIKNSVLKVFERSDYNIFISDFTFKKLISQGLRPDYSRDIVYHNGIDLKDSQYIENDIEEELHFICVARDVPHKNLEATVLFCEKIKKLFPQINVFLYLTSSRFRSQDIVIEDISGVSNNVLDEYYKKSHFNLLFSKDDSNRGFYEGFGLTCLEAGKYGVPSIVSPYGGLPENVHHGLNGLVLNSETLFLDCTKIFWDKFAYKQMRKDTFNHTHSSHGVDKLTKLWRAL